MSAICLRDLAATRRPGSLSQMSLTRARADRYRIQELAYGGLRPETRKRLEALGERLDGGNAVLRRIRADNRPLLGTQIIREYEGVQHVVTVRADDFEYEGRPYQSLSAIARHITGTRWNGWVFFGLKSGAHA